MLAHQQENPKEIGSILKNYSTLILGIVAWIGAVCGVVALNEYQIKELFSITQEHTVQIAEQENDASVQNSQIAVIDTKLDMVSGNVMDIKRYLKVPA